MTKVALLAIFLLTFGELSNGDASSDQKISDAANCFTLNMYKELAKTEENLVSSPFSLDVLLSMLYVGAGGRTAQELSTSLGYNDISVEDMKNAFQSKLDKLKSSDGNTLELANSIWIQKEFDIKPSFIDAVSQKFNSQLNNVDFAGNSHGTTQAINSWGNIKTRGLIPTLFNSDVDKDTIMLLINAIYFKGKWTKPFPKDNTKLGKFRNNDSADSPSTVQLMNKRSKFLYHQDKILGAQILEMSYVGDNISMVLILPDQRSNIDNLEKSLSCQNFMSGVRSTDPTLVDVTMPKFEISSSFDLVKPIMNLGIKNAFEHGANFSGIASNIEVSKAIQKAVVKVYEEGSEAAVLTAIEIVPYSLLIPVSPPRVVYFRADHPFLFLIRDKRTDLILFMGRVKNLPNSS